MRKLLHPFSLKIALCFVIVLLASCKRSNHEGPASSDIEYWVTSGDKSNLLKKSASGLSFGTGADSVPSIEVDTTQRFQGVDGFGFALTGGSAYLIHQKLTKEQQTALLKELFQFDGNNIGISYLRISIGSSDLDDHVFSYDDLPPGQTEPSLAKFSLNPDERDLIPVLKQIVELRPDIKIMG